MRVLDYGLAILSMTKKQVCYINKYKTNEINIFFQIQEIQY